MKSKVVIVSVLIFLVACARMDRAKPPETLSAVSTQIVLVNSTTTAARKTLERFMQARVNRKEQHVLDLLSESLLTEINNNTNTIQPQLSQVSNPCWYRYLILQFERPTQTEAHARIRMYEHFWGGDNMGGVPRSWEQTITLIETNAGWRVNALGLLENERPEPNEPHGETISACNVARTP